MPSPVADQLSRRERQIMTYLHQHGAGTVAEVQAGLDDAPSYSAVRTLLGIMEEKGWVKHREEGRRYVYEPTIARDAAQRSALQNLVKTFFDGSVAQAMAALLDTGDRTLTSDEAERLARLIDQRKQEGR